MRTLSLSLFFCLIFALTASAGSVYHDNVKYDVTQNQPVEIYGGLCWEGVKFTGGEIKNNFIVNSMPNGIHVTWSGFYRLENGVGAVSGMTYEAKENFSYVFSLAKDHVASPQQIRLRLTQTVTKRTFTILLRFIIITEQKTGSVKVVVDKYEIECP